MVSYFESLLFVIYIQGKQPVRHNNACLMRLASRYTVTYLFCNYNIMLATRLLASLEVAYTEMIN
jgi:hypothetical protein